MKTIIDTLKEIIKKDASTQTEPVTIIENEKSMTKVISYGELELPLKRKETMREEEELRKQSKIMSGIEHVEKDIEMKEEKQIKSDTNFYDKCKAYLKIVNPKNDTYFSIKHTITTDVIKNKQAASQSNKSIFATNFDNYTTLEEQQELLQEFTAAMYVLYTDEQNLMEKEEYSNAQELILANLTEVVGNKIAGEVIDFLEHYEG